MRRRWVSADGWEIEPIILDGWPVLRVRYMRSLRGYCRTITEAAQWVDLAELVEVVDLRARPGLTDGRP